MKVHFIHGWGFNPDIWSEISSELNSFDVSFTDLGFLTGNSGAKNLIPENSLIIGHSLGVMWALKHRPKSILGFVSIAGFDCFYKHTGQTTLRAMSLGLARDPEKQMKRFWCSCGTADFCAKEHLNPIRLGQGLDWLSRWDAKEILTDLRCKKIALAAKDDIIVPEKMSREIWPETELKWIDTGGHALPLTQPEWCAREITYFARKLQP